MKKLIIITLSLCTFYLHGQNLEWVLVEHLPAGLSEGSCISATDCDRTDNSLCYALVYTADTTDVVTSYTTYFDLDCPSNNEIDITYNESCIMNDNSAAAIVCPSYGIRFNCSANSGTMTLTKGEQYVIHEVCFTVVDMSTRTVVRNPNWDSDISFGIGAGASTFFLDANPNRMDADAVCSSLSVNLLSFDAQQRGDNSLLTWVTGGEVNNDYFDVERSTNGYEFYKIGQVDGAGTTASTQNYTFLDDYPVKGRNYYRLKQVDFGGEFAYSQVREVNFNGLAELDKYSVYPNPTTDYMGVIITGEDFGKVKMFNLAGQTIREFTQMQGQKELRIDLKGVVPGIYFFKFENGVTEKLVIH